jgi:hypothetical protein
MITTVRGALPNSRTRRRLAMALLSVLALLMASMVTLVSAAGATTGTGGSSATTSCKAPPVLSSGARVVRATPPASSTSGGAPGSVIGTQVAPSGASVNLVVRCSWTATFPATPGVTPDSRSVSYTELATTYMALGTSYTFHIHGDGVSCTSTGEVLNGFGGGGAQAKLVQTHCNTYSGFTTALGTVQIVGGTFATGPVKLLTHFGTPVQTSFVSGHSVFYGSFQDCSEDPVGQTTSFACVYWNGGPFS